MSAHAFKKVAKLPQPAFSFVAAVKRNADLWWINAPPASRDHGSQDEHERALMWLMERGVVSRVGDLAEPSDRDILPGFNCMWTAVRADYDGAPDSNCPSGSGYTKFQAIADLLDAEEMRAEGA